MRSYLCMCGSGKNYCQQFDARGIPLCRTCPDCHAEKMKKYRKEVLVNSSYESNEPIEEEY